MEIKILEDILNKLNDLFILVHLLTVAERIQEPIGSFTSSKMLQSVIYGAMLREIDGIHAGLALLLEQPEYMRFDS